MRVKLDTRALRTATPPTKGYVLCWDSELCGFGVRITASGARTFIVEKRVRGRTRRVSLGRWPAVTIASARKRAQVYLGRVAAGEDPIAEKARGLWVSRLHDSQTSIQRWQSAEGPHPSRHHWQL
jgi:hypothetical protein